VQNTCVWYKSLHSTLPAVRYCQGLPIVISGFRQLSLHQCVCVQLFSAYHACTIDRACTMHEQCMHTLCAVHASTKADAMHRACCKLSSTSGLDPRLGKQSYGKGQMAKGKGQRAKSKGQRAEGRQSPARLTVIGRQGVVQVFIIWLWCEIVHRQAPEEGPSSSHVSILCKQA